MSDDGKAKTRSGKKRKGRAKAAAKRSAPAAAEPETATAATVSGTDEPSAPVGFTARDMTGDGGGDAKPEPTAKKGGGAGVAAFFVLVVAVVAAAGYLTRAAWLPGAGDAGKQAAVADEATAPKPSPPSAATPAPAASETTPSGDAQALEAMAREREQLRAELNRLMARLDGVEKSMDTAKQMIRATAPPEEKVAGGPSLEQLSERIGALEKQETALTELRQRVEKMEQGAAAGASGNRAIVLAVAGLGDAISRGEPYQRHLETLKAVAAGDPNIKAAVALLAKGAAEGIPTFGGLRARFDGLAGRIVRAAKTADDDGWMARAANRISSLITWRRVGEAAAGDSVDAVVAACERHLAAGDLAGAVKALDGLAAVSRNAAAAADAWLADAKARVTAERTVASLHVHAVSLLAPDKP